MPKHSTEYTELVEFDPVELPSRYAKALVAIATAVVALLVTALTDDVVTLVEVLGVGVAGVTAVGVYLVPNLPAGVGRYAKAAVAVVGTGVQAAIPLVTDGTITSSGWLLILLAVLGALSVGIVPNQPPPLAQVQQVQEPR
jgi:hypothetical protein